MKTTPPRRRRQAQSRKEKIAAAVRTGTARGVGEASARGRALNAAKTKHGPRPTWGPLEYAQDAITALFPVDIPRNVNKSGLCHAVNEHLARAPAFQATLHGQLSPRTGKRELSRQTVMRALEMLRAANPHLDT